MSRRVGQRRLASAIRHFGRGRELFNGQGQGRPVTPVQIICRKYDGGLRGQMKLARLGEGECFQVSRLTA